MVSRLRDLLNCRPCCTSSDFEVAGARYKRMDDDSEAADTVVFYARRSDESDRPMTCYDRWCRWKRGIDRCKCAKSFRVKFIFLMSIIAIIFIFFLLSTLFKGDQPPLIEDPYVAECHPPIQLPFHPNGTGRFPEEGLHFIPCKAAHDFNVALMKQVKERMAEGLWNKDGTIMKEGGEDSFKKYSIHYALAIARPTNVTYEELDGYWGEEYGKVKCFSISNWADKELPGPNWACQKGQAAYTVLATAEDRSLFPDQPALFMHYTQSRVFLFAFLHNSDFASVIADVVGQEMDMTQDEIYFEMGDFYRFLRMADYPEFEDRVVAHLNGKDLRKNSTRWAYRAGYTVKPVQELLRRLEKSCMTEFTPEHGQTWADCIRHYAKSLDANMRRSMKIAEEWRKGKVPEKARNDNGENTNRSSQDDLSDEFFEEL